MRATIRLPDELYRQVRMAAASGGETVTSFIAEALRAALARRDEALDSDPYRVRAFAGDGLRPGVCLDDNAALLELMDSDARP